MPRAGGSGSRGSAPAAARRGEPFRRGRASDPARVTPRGRRAAVRRSLLDVKPAKNTNGAPAARPAGRPSYRRTSGTSSAGGADRTARTDRPCGSHAQSRHRVIARTIPVAGTTSAPRMSEPQRRPWLVTSAGRAPGTPRRVGPSGPRLSQFESACAGSARTAGPERRTAAWRALG